MDGPLSGPIALHTWTLGARPLAEVLEVAESVGYDAVELNWQDIARCRGAGMSDREIAALVADSPLDVAVVGVEPGWLFAEGPEASRLWDGFQDTAETAVALGCRSLMSAVGRNAGPLERARDAMRLAGDRAAALGLTLAIEFNFTHPVLRSPADVLDIVRASGRATCGLVLDTYHLHRAGYPGRGFEEIPGDSILAFQFSDVPARPAPDGGVPMDRLPPGEGRVQWAEVLRLLGEKDYAGPMVYEAPNPDLWRRPPGDIARAGLKAFRTMRDAAMAHLGT